MNLVIYAFIHKHAGSLLCFTRSAVQHLIPYPCLKVLYLYLVLVIVFIRYFESFDIKLLTKLFFGYLHTVLFILFEIFQKNFYICIFVFSFCQILLHGFITFRSIGKLYTDNASCIISLCYLNQVIIKKKIKKQTIYQHCLCRVHPMSEPPVIFINTCCFYIRNFDTPL